MTKYKRKKQNILTVIRNAIVSPALKKFIKLVKLTEGNLEGFGCLTNNVWLKWVKFASNRNV